MPNGLVKSGKKQYATRNVVTDTRELKDLKSRIRFSKTIAYKDKITALKAFDKIFENYSYRKFIAFDPKAESLTRMFVFSKTDEGIKFWQNIYLSVR